VGNIHFLGHQDELSRPAAMPLGWNHHRKIIQDLYLTDGKSLKELMAIMETKYDFHAT
jgi:hypothetical protein